MIWFQICQICHPNWIRLAPNRLGLFNISFSTFWLGESQICSIRDQSDPIWMANLTFHVSRCWSCVSVTSYSVMLFEQNSLVPQSTPAAHQSLCDVIVNNDRKVDYRVRRVIVWRVVKCALVQYFCSRVVGPWGRSDFTSNLFRLTPTYKKSWSFKISLLLILARWTY